jgi:glycine cleavage system H protein
LALISQVSDRGRTVFLRVRFFCLLQQDFNNPIRKPQPKRRFQMNIPEDLKYTKNDEWVKVEGDTGIIGITDYAQEQLSDIVFIEVIADKGEDLSQGDACATVESVKAAADIYMPVSGSITAINEDLPDTPELINSDPYGAAWIIKVNLSDPDELDELLDADAYKAYCEERE